MKNIIYAGIFIFATQLQAQNIKEKIIWDKLNNMPVPYTTVTVSDSHSVSNENGYFYIDVKEGKFLFQNPTYEDIEVDYDFYKKHDTIFMNPKVYVLEEVVVVANNKIKTMLQNILTQYALQPHQESFFLRAIIKKNNEYYKIVDFSGVLEKKTLFNTKSKPMPKNNYGIQVENMRKVGMENKSVDFEMLSFESFLNSISSTYMNPSLFDLKYEKTDDAKFTKIILTPKNPDSNKTKGYYYVNNDDNTFNEVYMTAEDNNVEFNTKKDIKYRTTTFETKSNFKKNLNTQKYQLNLSVLKYNTEVISKEKKDDFEVTYIYYAYPLKNKSNIKSNINIKKDMFDLNVKYDENYWMNQEILPLTSEMQEFVDKMVATERNPNFRPKTNIK